MKRMLVSYVVTDSLKEKHFNHADVMVPDWPITVREFNHLMSKIADIEVKKHGLHISTAIIGLFPLAEDIERSMLVKQ